MWFMVKSCLRDYSFYCYHHDQQSLSLFLSLTPFIQNGDSCFNPVCWCIFTWRKGSTIISTKHSRVQRYKLTSWKSWTQVKEIEGVHSQLLWTRPKYELDTSPCSPICPHPLLMFVEWMNDCKEQTDLGVKPHLGHWLAEPQFHCWQTKNNRLLAGWIEKFK